MTLTVAEYIGQMATYGIPDYMRESLAWYLAEGRPVGHFLTAVLENDLTAAVKRGDDQNLAALVGYVRFLFNHAPIGSWGYTGAVRYWQAFIHAEEDRLPG